ncbi:multicopper oxidase domain-containing protein [Streptomyces sp. NPDC047043]|uniref:multicopper oxidase family protein n=1 Tax=Streptomyces sp. NPDC047043 TaxID=3154497 RepID=UPI0033FFB69C
MTNSLPRRRMLAFGTGALAAGLTGCVDTKSEAPTRSATRTAKYVQPHDAVVEETEKRRYHSGARPVTYELVAGPEKFDVAGRTAATWGYASLPGTRELRANAGDTLSVRLVNSLPEPTTVHWHGIRIRNDMDGAAPVTQPAVEPGKEFTYTFDVADPGTYWYHSHVGLQTDRGLYGPLVVEDPDDRSGVATDQVIVIDDWLDGLGATPDEVLRVLNPNLGGGSMAGMHMGSAAPSGSATPAADHAVSAAARALVPSKPMSSAALGGVTGEVAHPVHLINGRPPADRQTVRVRSGSRVRLRIVNAAADTAYRFAVAGHRMTVTHTDGYPVVPFETDTLIIGMAERYDVLVTPRPGAWPVVAKAEGKPGHAAALLRTTDSRATRAPGPQSLPRELDRRMLHYTDLTPLDSARLKNRAPDRSYSVDLIGAMERFVWGVAGRDAAHLTMSRGQRVRIAMTNRTAMWHPMHLHGHTFAVGGAHGIRKDTVQVLPGETVSVDFDADNPGAWMLHCHNAYHMEAGMTANINYTV